MRFLVLGPLEVEGAGPLGGPRPRALLRELLLASGTVVSTERLIDAVWGEDPPESARHALQVYVSHLRKAVGRERIVSEPAGYRIAVEPEELDALTFERLTAEGRAALASGDDALAAERLGTALALWRGPIDGDDPSAARLEALRVSAREDELEARLRLGRHAEVLPDLERLVREEPLRERLHGQLMVALYRAGRQADALTAYRRARSVLGAELGLEPGPELRALELAILRQDTALDVEPAELRERRRLPAPATPLIGRRRQVDEVRDLLSGRARLVTLLGPGGAGKTRIALQAAYELAARLPDGVHFVDLAPLRDPALVAGQVAATLGTEADALEEHLRERELLLLLDNFEQVDDAAPLVATLLRAAPGLRCLVTSRRALRLYGEHSYDVGPLELWDEAVTLFVTRAQAAGARAAAAPEVATLCTALDCLPLAVELVAARARALSAAEMVALPQRLGLAADGPRDLPARQQTLAATIAWSHDLLDARLRSRFAALSVFAGGWDAAAARAVAGAGPGDLDALCAHNLVRRDGERFTMLETIREFAAQRLPDEVRERHATHILDLAEHADRELREGGDQALWLGRLDLEHANARAALDWFSGRPEELRFAGALASFWAVRGHAAEGLERGERALRCPGSPAERAKALAGTSILAWARGQHERSRALAKEALDLYRALDDGPGMVRALANLGFAATAANDLARARSYYEEGLAVAERAGRPRDVAVALNGLTDLALQARELERARQVGEQALTRGRASGDAESIAVALFNLGYVALHGERLREAARLLREAAAAFDALGDEETVGLALEGLALAVADPEPAARLLGAAAARREATGGTTSFEDDLRAGGAERIRAALGPEAFEQAAAAGAEESLEALLAL